jgi:hypothetical protein
MENNDAERLIEQIKEHHRGAHGSAVVVLCDMCSVPICEVCSGGFELIDGVEMHYCKSCQERNITEQQRAS